MKTKTISVIAMVGLLCPMARADDARLKETLRTLTLRLRSAETERNNLLSEKAQSEQEKKTLTAKVDALTKQAAAQKDQIDELTKKSDGQDKELIETKDSLGKWKAAYEQLSTAAKKIEGERAKFASESVVLKRKLDDRERKNLELFKLGNEILARYERFGLGDALAAREPFTGIAKVKLETLVQDYQDKIADNFVKAEKQSNPSSPAGNPSPKAAGSPPGNQEKPTPR
jgi:chromosome segregation ATPase